VRERVGVHLLMAAEVSIFHTSLAFFMLHQEGKTNKRWKKKVFLSTLSIFTFVILASICHHERCDVVCSGLVFFCLYIV
jgi:hypothetical protein